MHDGRRVSTGWRHHIDMFMRDGQIMNYFEAWQAAKSVGVTGAGLRWPEMRTTNTEQREEALPLGGCSAIKLASEGFIVSPRLAQCQSW
jgi:hypothetical protein